MATFPFVPDESSDWENDHALATDFGQVGFPVQAVFTPQSNVFNGVLLNLPLSDYYAVRDFLMESARTASTTWTIDGTAYTGHFLPEISVENNGALFNIRLKFVHGNI